MSKTKIVGIASAVIVLAALLGWIFTAPYLSNEGLGRLPGVILGGTPTPAPADFTPLNDTVRGPLIMKLAGFPPFANYLSWVGTPDGVITATRPDGGLWAQRVRDRGGDGWLRIGDATYTMEAFEIHGEERLRMMEQWAGKIGRSVDEPLYPGSEPLRDWEVFFWRPRAE
ncbi:MAG: hypothetical protein RLZZ385_1655 [Pseudomonadota bacterium]|jgi:CubicO group peptidase (beta-lactamase class C family)